MPTPKAEHLLCMILSSKDAYDVLISGYHLYYCLMDEFGTVSFRYVDSTNGDDKQLRCGGFDFSTSSMYHPEWAKRNSSSMGYGLLARFPNDANLKFNICRKTTAAQKKILDDEKVVSSSNDITVATLQTLMIKNRTLALTDPMAFVAAAFQVSRDGLQNAITVHKCKNGFNPTVNVSLFDSHLVRKVRQISEVREERRPVYNLKHRQPVYDLECGLSHPTWLYKTKNGGVIALLLHLLMNVQFRDGTSWTFRYMKDTKDLLVLVPHSECGATMEVVATIFRQGKDRGTKINAKYFDQSGKAGETMVIGRDNIGVFDRSLLG